VLVDRTVTQYGEEYTVWLAAFVTTKDISNPPLCAEVKAVPVTERDPLTQIMLPLAADVGADV
jgi:hypothetical protein